MKKKLFRTFSALLVCVVLSGGTGMAQVYASSSIPQTSTVTAFVQAQSDVQPQADIIDWRYKYENGKLYKRLYNYSTETWIGEWILVV